MNATTSVNEQRLIDALQFIVRETMDSPPLPPVSSDSYLPANVIEFAQQALAAYGAAIAPKAPVALQEVWLAEIQELAQLTRGSDCRVGVQ